MGQPPGPAVADPAPQADLSVVAPCPARAKASVDAEPKAVQLVNGRPRTSSTSRAAPQEEEVVDLPVAAKASDPLHEAFIQRCVDGTAYRGKVVDIEVGSVSKQRLYLIKYDDGDLEHLTNKQVGEFRVPAPACAFCKGTGRAGFSACAWCAS